MLHLAGSFDLTLVLASKRQAPTDCSDHPSGAKRSYMEEVETLLHEHGVEFDPKFLS